VPNLPCADHPAASGAGRSCQLCQAYPVSSSDFRQLALKGEAGRAERLFRAAVSAFCCLTRPSRREIAQLEDLTLPLFDQVSVESRRYVAAALSECEYAPEALVRRLCDEPVEIAAPLLIRSGALTDIDLIALIGRHGLKHARAIGRRPNLNTTSAQLVAALDGPTLVRLPLADAPSRVAAAADDRQSDQPSSEPTPMPDTPLEKTRRHLRSMMLPAVDRHALRASQGVVGGNYGKLRETALSGSVEFFQAALVDALAIDLPTARSLTETSSYASLLFGLRALDMDEDRAFLITAAIYPGQFAHPEGIRLFLDRYDAVDHDSAIATLRNWKMDAIARAVEQPPQRKAVAQIASNSDGKPDARLRAS
jgi:uncharacterized protein (DUF2336 family)